MSKTFFQSRHRKLLRTFDREASLVRTILAERYGGEFARTVLREARMEFETLIPVIPFIGGSRNPMQSDLIESVHLLAFHRVMKAHAKTAQETSAIIDRGIRLKLARYPRFLMRLVGKLQFSRIFLRRLQNLALESQKRKYPENFVFKILIGDGGEFDWGIDFTECAIQKFYESQNAGEFLPYICPNDFMTSEAFDLGMTRTKTLAEGAECCNPRLRRGRPTQRVQPPGFPA